MFLNPQNITNVSTFMTELDAIMRALNIDNKDFLIAVLNINLLHVDIVNKEHLTSVLYAIGKISKNKCTFVVGNFFFLL